MKKLLCFSLLTPLFTGCALSDTTVMPRANNEYEILSTASSEHYSIQGALDKANKICKEKFNKRAVVISHSTVYQGVDKTAGTITDTIAILASSTFKNNEMAPTTRRDDDYKTNLHFKCE